MELKNCSALITGGASGMGKATAMLLSEHGAYVAILDKNYAQAKQVAATIPHTIAIPCDITDENSVINALNIISTTHGPARICINCAGIARSSRMVGKNGPQPLAEFREVIDINLLGTFNVMRLAAAEMIKLESIPASGERGVIINTASIAAFEGQIGQTAYSAAKGGIVSLTLPAARELAQFGIRVNTIAPGLVDTPLFDALPAEVRANLANAVPFPKRLAKPSEYANLVLHIIENVMLNGSIIRLDGALRMPPT